MVFETLRQLQRFVSIDDTISDLFHIRATKPKGEDRPDMAGDRRTRHYSFSDVNWTMPSHN